MEIHETGGGLLIIDSLTVLGLNTCGWNMFTWIESAFRKRHNVLVADCEMVRCFEGRSGWLHSYWKPKLESTTDVEQNSNRGSEARNALRAPTVGAQEGSI